MTRDRVDPERLAALLDRRLDEAERERLLAQLAGSDEDLAIHADAAAVMDALESEDSAGAAAAAHAASVAPGPGRWLRFPALPLAAAAAIALAIAVPVARRATLQRNAGDPGRMAALVIENGTATALAGARIQWSGTRGRPVDLPAQTRAIRLGARLVDLDLALAAGPTAARPVAGEIAALLQTVPAGGGLADPYARFARGDSQPTAAALKTGTGNVLAVAGEEYARLGAVAEAARLAARARNASFFDDGYLRASLQRAGRIPGMDAGTRANLERLTRSAASPAPRWTAIEEAAEGILGGQAP